MLRSVEYFAGARMMTESTKPQQLSMLLAQSVRCVVCDEPFEIPRQRGRAAAIL